VLRASLVQSPRSTLQSTISFILQFQMILSHSICEHYIVNGSTLLACDSTRMSVEQRV
jgi:hypothetical protein